MIRMLAVVVVALVAVPSLVNAQAPSSEQPSVSEAPSTAPSDTQTGVQQEIRRKRFVVLPRPPIETVVEDTARAREELTATSRRDELIRESRQRPLSRPELDYSITSGIQSQRVLRALPR